MPPRRIWRRSSPRWRSPPPMPNRMPSRLAPARSIPPSPIHQGQRRARRGRVRAQPAEDRAHLPDLYSANKGEWLAGNCELSPSRAVATRYGSWPPAPTERVMFAFRSFRNSELYDIVQEQWGGLEPNRSAIRAHPCIQGRASREAQPGLPFERFAPVGEAARENEQLKPIRVVQPKPRPRLPILEADPFMAVVEQDR